MTLFAGGYGGPGVQTVEAMAIAGDGSIWIGGSFQDQLALPGMALESTGGLDGWVSRWSADGVLIFAERYGDFSTSSQQNVHGIGLSGEDEVYLTGVFSTEINIAGYQLAENGFANYVARVEPVTGDWATSFTHGGGLFGCPVAVARQSVTGPILWGTCEPGQLQFENTSLDSMQRHVVLAKLSQEGVLQWGKLLPTTGALTRAAHVEVGPDGSVYVAGVLEGVLDLDDGLLSSVGAQDGFVAKFTPEGGYVWGALLMSDEYAEVRSLALQPDGTMIVVGEFRGSLSGVRSQIPSAGAEDALIAGISSTGTLLWVRSYGGALADSFTDVGMDSHGFVMAAGHTQGDIDLGEGALEGSGLQDIMVAKFDSQGAIVWSRIFGSVGDDTLRGALIGPGDNTVLAGTFAGGIDFGTGIIPTGGDDDVFLAILGP